MSLEAAAPSVPSSELGGGYRDALAIVSVVVAGLGVLVMLGWAMHWPRVVQLHPSFVPMQFNTALGFLLAGTAALSLRGGCARCGVIAASALALLASLTLLQYLSGASFGLDELFMTHDITVRTSHPGRMAPNTALCFLLTAAALLVSAGHIGPGGDRLGAVLAATVFLLASTAAVGYLAGVSSVYTWGRLTAMALHTAAAFMLISGALLGTMWRRKGQHLPRWSPIFFSLILFSISVQIWQAILESGQRGAGRTVLLFGVLASLLFGVALHYMFRNNRLLTELAGRSQELDQRLDIATASARLGIWRWDIATDELIVSARFRELFGIREDEAVSYERAIASIHPEDRERVDKVVRHAVDNQHFYDTEYRSLWPDGSVHWLAAYGQAYYDDDGQPLRMEGVVQDIRERKQSEIDIRQANEALLRSNRELERFAYVASHDLQEPLRMVASYLQLLERRYKGRLDAQADEFIDFAVGGAKRMKRLIQGLLEVSRLGSRGIQFQHCEMDAVLHRACASLGKLVEENGAVVTQDPLPSVTGDAVQLEQLFGHLIDNAIRFRTDLPPRIHVSALPVGESTIDVPGPPMAQGWLFSVRDNGIGIDADFGEDAFQIFKRHGRGEGGESAGIGLAVCRKIVELHGGRIWVVSDGPPAGGCTFLFTLPSHPDRFAGHAAGLNAVGDS